MFPLVYLRKYNRKSYYNRLYTRTCIILYKYTVYRANGTYLMRQQLLLTTAPSSGHQEAVEQESREESPLSPPTTWTSEGKASTPSSDSGITECHGRKLPPLKHNKCCFGGLNYKTSFSWNGYQTTTGQLRTLWRLESRPIDCLGAIYFVEENKA